MSDKKFALVTGANKGIGFATARELEPRVSSSFWARDAARGQEADASRRRGNGCPFRELDVTRPDAIEAARAQIEREARRLDILVNNAGISVESGEQTTLEGLPRVYETNVFAPSRSRARSCPCSRKDAPR